jgi:hypothetical protein
MKAKDKSSKQSSSPGSKQSGNQGSRSGATQGGNQAGTQGGSQGGLHEQHVDAGRPGQKNDNKRSSRSR